MRPSYRDQNTFSVHKDSHLPGFIPLILQLVILIMTKQAELDESYSSQVMVICPKMRVICITKSHFSGVRHHLWHTLHLSYVTQ